MPDDNLPVPQSNYDTSDKPAIPQENPQDLSTQVPGGTRQAPARQNQRGDKKPVRQERRSSSPAKRPESQPKKPARQQRNSEALDRRGDRRTHTPSRRAPSNTGIANTSQPNQPTVVYVTAPPPAPTSSRIWQILAIGGAVATISLAVVLAFMFL